MKLSNKVKLYLHVALLFVFTFLLAKKVIIGFTTNDFNFIRIVINAVVVVSVIFQIIKYAAIENNKH